nr:DNA methyltransferase [Eubacteriaceae bacterium]
LSTRGYMALIKNMLGTTNAGMAYIFTDWRMWTNLFDAVESSGFGVRNMIVWDKGSPGMGNVWRTQHEICMMASKIKMPFDKHKAKGNVIQCGRTGNINHPTEKPVELLTKIIGVTDFCGTFFDPFAGSGTTLVACEGLGRTCYAMELDPKYCDVIIERWEELTGETAKKVN